MSEAVASKEPELVLRLIVVAVVFVDVKLTLCKSSDKSSSHGSIEPLPRVCFPTQQSYKDHSYSRFDSNEHIGIHSIYQRPTAKKTPTKIITINELTPQKIQTSVS